MYIRQRILAPFPASTTQSVQRPVAFGCGTVFGLAEQNVAAPNEPFTATASAYHISGGLDSLIDSKPRERILMLRGTGPSAIGPTGQS